MIWHFYNCRSYHVAEQIRSRWEACGYLGVPGERHGFIIYGATQEYSTYYTCLMNGSVKLQWCDSPFRLLAAMRDVKSTDGVILHSFSRKFLYFFLLSRLRTLHRIILICWGGEVGLERGIRGKVKRFVKHSLFSELHRVIALDCSDARKLKENYGLENVTVCPYPMPSFLENICTQQEVLERYASRSPQTKVIVGNNRSRVNRHIDCLRLLERYREHPIQIVCPFGYANADVAYANEVASYGHRVFGHKFVLLDRFLPIEEYVSLLKSADILVIHCEEQRSLFGIYAFLLQGKKIYVPQKTDFKCWLNELGASTHDIEQIASESYEEFSKKLDYDIAISNIVNAKKIVSNERISQVWSEIYADLGRGTT